MTIAQTDAPESPQADIGTSVPIRLIAEADVLLDKLLLIEV
jgi:hypothetical protein